MSSVALSANITHVLNYIVGGNVWLYRQYVSWDVLVNDIKASLGISYEQSLQTVHNRANWNLCKKWGGSDFTCGYNKSVSWNLGEGNPFISLRKVKSVFNTYCSLATQQGSTIPPIDPNNKVEFEKLVKDIATKAGVTADITSTLFKEAFYAFKSNELQDDFLIDPRRFREMKEIRSNRPADAPGAPDGGLIDTVSDTLNILKWVGIAVVGGAILYFTAPVWLPNGK